LNIGEINMGSNDQIYREDAKQSPVKHATFHIRAN
jgi:hypothetical protein